MTARSKMNPALTWSLAGTVLASAWALWWPNVSDDSAARGAVARRSANVLPAPVPSAGMASEAAASPNALVANDGPRLLSPASRDPFHPAPAPVSAEVTRATAKATKNEPMQPLAPVAPVAPPMNHRIVGRFVSPDGQRMVFLQDGPQTVLAVSGAVLSSGYAVDAVTPRELRLRHPMAGQAVSMPMPDDNAP